MSKPIIVTLAAAALLFTSVAPSVALPPVGFSVAPRADAGTSVDETRLYCYNRYNGRFLHWGPCGGYGYVRRPRVYCRNVYTGRFLHWGSCW